MIRIYADLNCPFCFSLHERLLILGVMDKVQWNTIEHAPTVESDKNDLSQKDQLRREYDLVRKRAPEVTIRNPGFLPNTRLANTYLMLIQKQHPQHTQKFRTLMYRAYWQEEKDISNPLVLHEILCEIGLDKLSLSMDVSSQLHEWQSLWEHDDFDKRIPVIQNKEREVLLGLQSLVTLKRFFEFGDTSGQENLGVCNFHENDLIYFLCKEESRSECLKIIDMDYIDIRAFSTNEEFDAALSVELPDAIIVHSDYPSSLGVSKRIKETSEALSTVPVILLSQNDDALLEAQAFHYGVSDVVYLPRQSHSLFDRLKAHIRTYQRVKILTQFASRDGLTGLYNRREFDVTFDRYWRNGCRDKKVLALMLLDIDHFKLYNDHYGHPAGDDVLVRVANAITRSMLRPQDIVARVGGEEFAILMLGLQEQDALLVADRIHEGIAKLQLGHEKSSTSKCVTASIGVAITWCHADNNTDMLYQMADDALYQAKESGRNKTSIAELLAPEYN